MRNSVTHELDIACDVHPEYATAHRADAVRKQGTRPTAGDSGAGAKTHLFCRETTWRWVIAPISSDLDPVYGYAKWRPARIRI